ncbi:hypothetical protein RFF05_05045 [Bengtsoniella intestinalis]|uniref:hypothetical protein n=1 Tax=Bengtsoniella intestinalis TaxID=3073143 RepID=UPI00391F0439
MAEQTAHHLVSCLSGLLLFNKPKASIDYDIEIIGGSGQGIVWFPYHLNPNTRFTVVATALRCRYILEVTSQKPRLEKLSVSHFAALLLKHFADVFMGNTSHISFPPLHHIVQCFGLELLL